MNTKHFKKQISLAIGATAFLILNQPPSAGAFTAQDATDIWNGYNNAFYVGNNGDAYYRHYSGSGKDTTDFWYNSEEIEMAVDRAYTSGSSSDKKIVIALIDGFDSNFGTDWTGVIYNDDVMWACLAHIRAYQVTGSTNSSWALHAADNFNWVYSGNHSPNRTTPQYDSTYGGGMWWTTDHSASGTKNACVNGPAALVAYHLYEIYGSKTGFLGQAQNMYNWEVSHLVQADGFIYDHYGNGGAVGADLSYNAGTCIGAGYFLGDKTTPGLVASYFMNTVCGGGILPNYGTGGGNNDGFNGIFMRWMALWMIQEGQQATYSTWMYDQANQAWAVANSSTLSWDDWDANTPTGTLYSWDCSDSVVALQVLPAQ
jgi:predicted alpha-1,6-mannanase (GH76 family)